MKITQIGCRKILRSTFLQSYGEITVPTPKKSRASTIPQIEVRNLPLLQTMLSKVWFGWWSPEKTRSWADAWSTGLPLLDLRIIPVYDDMGAVPEIGVPKNHPLEWGFL